MRIVFRILLIAAVSGIAKWHADAQKSYTSYQMLAEKLEDLKRDYPSVCSVRSLVKTAGGKDIFAITIGNGDMDDKPGIAVVGGVDGRYILGRELALGFAESLIRSSQVPEIENILKKVTFYVFPDMSPDATEQFFGELKYERNVNSASADDDRDFISGEDPFEDLNGDGYITLFRVKDPSGTFIPDREDARIMVTADLSKGELGSYIVHSEGIDNDKDGRYNEDGPGGISFNRNLTYNYEEFGTHSGLHPVSEAETKALMDFLFDHYNIYMTFAFGPQDNLGQPINSSERPADPASSSPDQVPGDGGMRTQGQRGKFTNILTTDKEINKLVSDRYHEITELKGAPSVKQDPGNFMEWSYFHYGRYSFSTPGWWFEAEKGKNPEIAFLKYAAENITGDQFIPWKEINHPDFPGKIAETGGIKPFATLNPPAEKIEELVRKHFKFLITVAEMHPRLEFLDLKVEKKDDNIFRVSLKVHNSGIFATCAESGENNMWTRLMRISVETSGNQKLLSGHKVQGIPRLEGDETAEFSWLIIGKGTIHIKAGAVNTGTINTTAKLN